MEQNEMIALRKEVNRLQSMIDILLEQNAQLKQTLYQCQAELNDIKTLPHVYESQLDGAKNVRHDTLLQMDGVTNGQRYSRPEMDGVNNDKYDTILQKDGVNNGQHDTSLQKGGVNNVPYDTILQMGGVTKVKNTIHDRREAANGQPASMPLTAGSAPGPLGQAPGATREVKKINRHIVFRTLEAMNPKSNSSGLINTAAILICLHQSPKQSLKDLQKLTGLSEDGITKRIMSMKKMGLVVRAPGRRLLLTARSEKIIMESRV